MSDVFSGSKELRGFKSHSFHYLLFSFLIFSINKIILLSILLSSWVRLDVHLRWTKVTPKWSVPLT